MFVREVHKDCLYSTSACPMRSVRGRGGGCKGSGREGGMGGEGANGRGNWRGFFC